MTESASLRPPAGFIFDLDGTLVDTIVARIDSWMAAFEEGGVPADRDHVAELIGADGVYLAHQVAERAGRQLEDEPAATLDRRSGELYEPLNVDPRPLPGAHDVLEALTRRGIPWVIATSSRPEQVAASVNALGLSRQPLIVDGSSVERAKPEPDLLLAAASDLSADPQTVWAVGDSRWDMLAAAAAGMTPIGVTTGATSGDALTADGARLVLRSLEELLSHADALVADASTPS